MHRCVVSIALASMVSCNGDRGASNLRTDQALNSAAFEHAAPDSTISGIILNIRTGERVPDTLVALSHVISDGRHELRLEALWRNGQDKRSRVLASRMLSIPQAGEYVTLGECELSGKPESTIIALVAYDTGSSPEHIRAAWRVNPERTTIDEFPTAGIDCFDEDADP